VEQEKQSNLTSRVSGQHALDLDKILETLGHLHTVDIQMARVDEIVDPLVIIIEGFRLSNFIFVMRESQIDTTRVDIKRSFENLAGHGRAFNMPTRSSFTPRRLPLGLTRLGVLPKSKILRSFLFRFISKSTFSFFNLGKSYFSSS